MIDLNHPSHSSSSGPGGPPPAPPAGSGGGGGLFNAQESNFLTNFLEGFDWDFQPSLPEGMPSYADAERSSLALGLEGLGSPPKSGMTPSASFGNGGSVRGKSVAARSVRGSGSGGSGGGKPGQSPAGASDVTSPRTGSGTSDTLTIVGGGGGGTPTRTGEGGDESGSRTKRRTTEASRAFAARQQQQAQQQHQQQQNQKQQQLQVLDGMLVPIQSPPQMSPLGHYPPHHPHHAIMQAAEENSFLSQFPFLPQGSINLAPASFQPLSEDLSPGTNNDASRVRTRTYEQMMEEEINHLRQLQQQQQSFHNMPPSGGFDGNMQMMSHQHLQQRPQEQQGQQHQGQSQQGTPAGGNKGRTASGGEPEKRQHHIYSEQRRRINIREGFKELVELLEIGRGFGARGLGLAAGAGTGIEDEGLDDRSDDEDDEEGSGLPPRKKLGKGRNRKSNAAARGKGKGRGRGGSAGGGAGSKSAVLFQAVDLLRWLQVRNAMIEEQCEKIETYLPKTNSTAMQM